MSETYDECNLEDDDQDDGFSVGSVASAAESEHNTESLLGTDSGLEEVVAENDDGKKAVEAASFIGDAFATTSPTSDHSSDLPTDNIQWPHLGHGMLKPFERYAALTSSASDMLNAERELAGEDYKCSLRRVCRAIQASIRQANVVQLLDSSLAEIKEIAPLRRGTLSVTILAGHSLHALGHSAQHLPSAFVLARIGDQEGKTSVVRWRTNPTWDRKRHVQTFEFPIRQLEAERTLQLTVLDATSLPPNFCIGSVELDVHEIEGNVWVVRQEHLQFESHGIIDSILEFMVKFEVEAVEDPLPAELWKQMLSDLISAFKELGEDFASDPQPEDERPGEEICQDIVGKLNETAEVRVSVLFHLHKLESLIAQIKASGVESTTMGTPKTAESRSPFTSKELPPLRPQRLSPKSRAFNRKLTKRQPQKVAKARPGKNHIDAFHDNALKSLLQQKVHQRTLRKLPKLREVSSNYLSLSSGLGEDKMFESITISQSPQVPLEKHHGKYLAPQHLNPLVGNQNSGRMSSAADSESSGFSMGTSTPLQSSRRSSNQISSRTSSKQVSSRTPSKQLAAAEPRIRMAYSTHFGHRLQHLAKAQPIDYDGDSLVCCDFSTSLPVREWDFGNEGEERRMIAHRVARVVDEALNPEELMSIEAQSVLDETAPLVHRGLQDLQNLREELYALTSELAAEETVINEFTRLQFDQDLRESWEELEGRFNKLFDDVVERVHVQLASLKRWDDAIIGNVSASFEWAKSIEEKSYDPLKLPWKVSRLSTLPRTAPPSVRRNACYNASFCNWDNAQGHV